MPVFCYHPRLNIAGNCRMCLVEIEKMPKPQASCALPVAEGMVVKTDTPAVHKARKGVLELLLINHPLDCPICDQGGECDLQDLTLFYGPDHSRFAENKRPVPDKYLGPLISTHMTRCIHCTRCIRFFTEVAGVEELGAVNRGEHMEITTWVEQALGSEISGNVIDLCPVGALNSKPYEYRARTWELRKTESVDVTDAVGCNIRVDARGSEVMRILPRLNEDVNEEWISDKARFSYDGLKRRRLDVPMVKHGRQAAADRLERGVRRHPRPARRRGRPQGGVHRRRPGRLRDHGPGARAGRSGWARRMSTAARTGRSSMPRRRAGYLFNSTIAGIDQADACLLVGTNPRWEAPIVNARLRKRWRAGGFKVGRIGAVHPLTYPVEELGAGTDTLAALARGELGFAETLRQAKRPMLIVGMGALARPDGAAILSLAADLAEELGLVTRRVERLQRAAHGGRARRRPRSRPGAGRGRPRRRRHPGRRRGRRDRDRVPDRCRRDRHRPAGQGVRGLSGPPWRPWRRRRPT